MSALNEYMIMQGDQFFRDLKWCKDSLYSDLQWRHQVLGCGRIIVSVERDSSVKKYIHITCIDAVRRIEDREKVMRALMDYSFTVERGSSCEGRVKHSPSKSTALFFLTMGMEPVDSSLKETVKQFAAGCPPLQDDLSTERPEHDFTLWQLQMSDMGRQRWKAAIEQDAPFQAFTNLEHLA